MSQRHWWSVFLLVVLAGVAYSATRLRPIYTTADEPALWECANEISTYKGPVLILRFARAPEHYAFQADDTGVLCRFFSHFGQPTVVIHSSVWGDRQGGMLGWSELTVNGQTVPSPYTFSGPEPEGSFQHPHPYAQDFTARLHGN